MKKIFWLFLISFSCLVCATFGHLLYLYTHREFRPDEFGSALVQKNTVILPQQEEKEKARIQHILNQSFSYLGLGKQMTAYESSDHVYVLKFFNPRGRLKEKWFHDLNELKFLCSLKWLSSAYFRRSERLTSLFERYAIAFKEMKEEAGLVYVHVNQQTALNQIVKVVDKGGAIYFVNLKDTPFVLQRKAELAGERLIRLQKQNDRKGMKKALAQLKALFVLRASKGITDRIQTLHNNYGFVGNKAIQIDVGRIRLDEQVKRDPQAEVDRILSNIQATWGPFLGS
jgi:hypothetical protein